MAELLPDDETSPHPTHSTGDDEQDIVRKIKNSRASEVVERSNVHQIGSAGHGGADPENLGPGERTSETHQVDEEAPSDNDNAAPPAPESEAARTPDVPTAYEAFLVVEVSEVPRPATSIDAPASDPPPANPPTVVGELIPDASWSDMLRQHRVAVFVGVAFFVVAIFAATIAGALSNSNNGGSESLSGGSTMQSSSGSDVDSSTAPPGVLIASPSHIPSLHPVTAQPQADAASKISTLLPVPVPLSVRPTLPRSLAPSGRPSLSPISTTPPSHAPTQGPSSRPVCTLQPTISVSAEEGPVTFNDSDLLGGNHQIDKIIAVEVYAGPFWGNRVVASIKTTYRLKDGSTRSLTNGNGGESAGRFVLEEGVHLRRIEFYRGKYVDWIRFGDTTGNWSNKLGGGNTGKSHTDSLSKDNGVIKSFLGHDGAVMDHLRAYFETDNCP